MDSRTSLEMIYSREELEDAIIGGVSFRLLRTVRSIVSNLDGEPRSLIAAQVLVASFFLKRRLKLARFYLEILV